ncbi:SPOSA6832_01496, partial [Sporobolomyces salmonicolor]
MSVQKVLVTGPTSSLSSYLAKLQTLQAKHKFDLVLAQDLFSTIADDDADLARLLKGDLSVPVQVYAAVGAGKLPKAVQEKVDQGEEVCSNLSVLRYQSRPPDPRIRSASRNPLWLFPLLDRSRSHLLLLRLRHLDPSLARPARRTCQLVPPPSPRQSRRHPPHPRRPLVPHPPLIQTPQPPRGPQARRGLQQGVGRACEGREGEVSLCQCPDRVLGTGTVRMAPRRWCWCWRGKIVLPCVEPGCDGEQDERTGAYFLPFLSPLTAPQTLPSQLALAQWFYAFSITPSAPGATPVTSTRSPFHASAAAATASLTATINSSNGPRGLKRPAALAEEGINEMGVPNYIFAGMGDQGRKKGKGGPPPDHYTCNICGQKGHWIQECPEKEARDAERAAQRANRGPRESAKPISPDECWFCLSNPKVTKHLIASIGTETYLTLPKGQVCSTDQSPVPGGGHVLLIPIAHYPTLRSIPADLAPPVLEEVELYKQALKKCYKSFGAEMIAFEVARAGGKGGHAHVQVMYGTGYIAHTSVSPQICPIPASLAPEAESTFAAQFTKFNLAFEEIADPVAFYTSAQEDGKGADYFKVDLPNGKCFVHWIKQGVPFGLQFGRDRTHHDFFFTFRETVALLLHAPERGDWKRCAKSDEEEKKDCQRFKSAFKSFDPST